MLQGPQAKNEEPACFPPNDFSLPDVTQERSSFKVKGLSFEEPADRKVIIDITSPGEADGPVAKNGDTVKVAYEGRLVDGTVFDSAASFKIELGAGEVIKGRAHNYARINCSGDVLWPLTSSLSAICLRAHSHLS